MPSHEPVINSNDPRLKGLLIGWAIARESKGKSLEERYGKKAKKIREAMSKSGKSPKKIALLKKLNSPEMMTQKRRSRNAHTRIVKRTARQYRDSDCYRFVYIVDEYAAPKKQRRPDIIVVTRTGKVIAVEVERANHAKASKTTLQRNLTKANELTGFDFTDVCFFGGEE